MTDEVVEWLKKIKIDKPKNRTALFEFGVEDLDDLKGLEEEDIEKLCQKMKYLHAKKIRKGIASQEKLRSALRVNAPHTSKF